MSKDKRDSACGVTSTICDADLGPRQRLFAIAARWHMPLQRQEGESVRSMAERLSLAIEHKIALMLLDLEEIATLDLDTEGDAS